MLVRKTATVVLFVLITVSMTVNQAEAQRPQRKGFQRPNSQQKGRRPGGRFRPVDKLKVGDTAPDFTLKSLNGKEQVTLSSFQDDKPVVLIFGSYT